MRGASQKSIDVNGRTLRKTVDAIAILVALAIALSTPLIYGLVAYQYEAATASLLAKLNADRVAGYIYEHGKMWTYQKIRLGELIETKQSSGEGANRILDAAGKMVVAEAELPARFQLTRSSAIVVAGATVGSIEHDTPLDSLLNRLGLVALFSLLLGFCTYLAVRIFPLRVLDRTLIHLAGANRTIHQKNADLEKQYCALLEREAALRSTEATLQHRSDQLVEAQLLGKIGDWSYRFGETTIAWAPELYDLLGYDAKTFGCSHAAVMAAYVDDGARRVLESQAEVDPHRRAPGRRRQVPARRWLDRRFCREKQGVEEREGPDHGLQRHHSGHLRAQGRRGAAGKARLSTIPSPASPTAPCSTARSTMC